MSESSLRIGEKLYAEFPTALRSVSIAVPATRNRLVKVVQRIPIFKKYPIQELQK